MANEGAEPEFQRFRESRRPIGRCRSATPIAIGAIDLLLSGVGCCGNAVTSLSLSLSLCVCVCVCVFPSQLESLTNLPPNPPFPLSPSPSQSQRRNSNNREESWPRILRNESCLGHPTPTPKPKNPGGGGCVCEASVSPRKNPGGNGALRCQQDEGGEGVVVVWRRLSWQPIGPCRLTCLLGVCVCVCVCVCVNRLNN